MISSASRLVLWNATPTMGQKLRHFALWLLCTTALQAGPTRFHYRTDTFAFSNDTVFAYGVDEAGRLTMRRREKDVEFSHRCFVLCRAVMQFHQFARFDPKAARVTPEEYRLLVKKVCRIPVWRSSPSEPIVIPGYRNLHDFSHAYEHMLKEELGNWLPSYLRVGNWRMCMAFPRFGQAWAEENLVRSLDRGKLQAVYLARNLHMNHCVVVFAHRRLENGDTQFDLYDPNYPGEVGTLTYRASERSFDFPKRWFWTGGRVNLMRVFISPLH